MGCCLSTKSSKPHLSQNNSSKDTTNSRAPPPTHQVLEEEAVVKEVLSETPIAIFSPNEHSKEHFKNSSPNAKLHQNNLILKQEQELNIVVSEKKLQLYEEHSEEVSEICSTLSESCVSTATETKNFGDDDNDVTQIRRHPSPVKYRNRHVSRDRVVGRQPGRVRSEPSPGRVRPGLGRDGRSQNSNGVRRGGVMGPDRRSRSPGTRVEGGESRAGLSRCPSGRRTGKSPGRGRFGPSGSVEKNSELEDRFDPEVDPTRDDRPSRRRIGKSPGRFRQPGLVEKNSKIDRFDPEVDGTNEESLENPLVSLECFIFL